MKFLLPISTRDCLLILETFKFLVTLHFLWTWYGLKITRNLFMNWLEAHFVLYLYTYAYTIPITRTAP